jgi:ribose transport system ATP-binding protein
MGDTSVLRITDLTKRFAGQLALDHVGLELAPGEIRGLIGENGAGKSTLIKILAGIYTPDDGRIEIEGQEVHPHLHNPPIAFVHQDLGLVDEMSVGENIAYTMGFPRRAGLINWRGVWRQAEESYDRMGLTAPASTMLVGRLLPAEKALLGIVRALATDARLAVLDEPTASLPAPDVQYLLDALLNLRRSGTPILYVTHRLQELYGVADSVTILRGGRKVAEGPISDFTVDDLVEQMLGRTLSERAVITIAPGDAAPIVRAEGLAVGGAEVSFELGHGEILGIVGLRGSGHEVIGRALAGAEKITGGSLTVGGDVISSRATILDRLRDGIALLPADRQRESTLPGMSLVENLFPGGVSISGSPWWISHSRERERTLAECTTYDVRPLQPALPIDQLSGGNQQKVVVARVLGGHRKLVVLEEPTAGVDVGSKFEIHEFVRKAAATGTGVIVVSSDFEEVSQLCTRVLIVVDGHITGEVSGAEITEERLIVLASSTAQSATDSAA